MGQEKIRVTKCDQELINEFIALGKECENTDGIKKTMGGKTMCANDFYEGMYINSMRFYETIFYYFLFDIRYSKGQGRIDGAFCEFTAEEKMKFLEHCSVNGIKNIEMESLCFTGLLNHAKLRGFQLYYNHL